MTVDTARAAAHKALEGAVPGAFIDLLRELSSDHDDVMPVDAALIIGTQWIDGDGDRCGAVNVLPRNGSQPYYATLGMLTGAQRLILDQVNGGE